MIDSLTATPDSRGLIVTWTAGGESLLTAALLRENARDAGARRERMENGAVTAAPELVITELVPVGAYGVNIRFSDGHHRAVYPFAYLRELSGRDDK